MVKVCETRYQFISVSTEERKNRKKKKREEEKTQRFIIEIIRKMSWKFWFFLFVLVLDEVRRRNEKKVETEIDFDENSSSFDVQNGKEKEFRAIPFRQNLSKFLVPRSSSVVFTDGFSSLRQDEEFERILLDEEMEIPSIGSDLKNCSISETVTFDLPGSSTRLPLLCKMIIQKQGASKEREAAVLVRDVSLQWNGFDFETRQNSTNFAEKPFRRSRSAENILLQNSTNLDDDDDDRSSIYTNNATTTIRPKVSRFLQRYKYSRQIETNLGLDSFYSVPFFQYAGLSLHKKNASTQTNQRFSVTFLLCVPKISERNNLYAGKYRTFNVDPKTSHSTVIYFQPTQLVTIRRTFNGNSVDS